MISQVKWPKAIPSLTDQQIQAREAWMTYWHEILPSKYGVVENFNHGFVANLEANSSVPIKTLEVGAGLGEHLKWEKSLKQEYYMLEYREDWCNRLEQIHPGHPVIHGDIQKKLQFEDNFFDRIIAIHVLEHLPDLPKALNEIYRILKPGGFFDIVLPCEGGLAYGFARKISSDRLFKKKFGIEYAPIIRAEHINCFPEILTELNQLNWISEKKTFFPLHVPLWHLNVCVGLRYKKLRA